MPPRSPLSATSLSASRLPYHTTLYPQFSTLLPDHSCLRTYPHIARHLMPCRTLKSHVIVISPTVLPFMSSKPFGEQIFWSRSLCAFSSKAVGQLNAFCQHSSCLPTGNRSCSHGPHTKQQFQDDKCSVIQSCIHLAYCCFGSWHPAFMRVYCPAYHPRRLRKVQ